MGFKVGILDADIYGPSIPIMFDVQNEKPLAVNVEGKSKMKPVESYGVKVLSIGFFHKARSGCCLERTHGCKSIESNDF